MLYIRPAFGDYLSTRGHSVATRWSSPSARFSDDTYVPYYHHRHFLDTSGEENAIRRNVNKELILTSNFIDDSYDMAAKSRNRDQEVLRDATRAIVDSETYHNPKAEVASRRARSQPPTMMHATQSVLRTSRASVPPPSITPSRPYVRRSHREAALVGSNVDVHVPHKKRPKSKYAASVIREINIKKHWEAGEGSPVESDIPTSHLHASPRPVAYRLIY